MARLDEWMQIRSLRLRALADDPDAFGSTLADAQTRTDDEWRSWIAGGPAQSAMVVATVRERHVGMAVGSVHERSGGAHLFAMWVDPDHRGAGVATALVKRVADWAKRSGHTDLTLHVAVDNTRAISLYEHCGFVITSETVDPEDCAMPAYQMRLDLG